MHTNKDKSVWLFYSCSFVAKKGRLLRMRKLPLLALLSLGALSAADISGTWIGSATGGRRNTVSDYAFQFVQNGTTLTGKAYQDNTSVPIIKGTIEGDQISFQVLAREQNGNEILTAV